MAIKVLIVDDSAVIRSILTEMIKQQPDMEVVGTASDPYIAREQIKKLNPDVLTLDIEMPRMDGVTFLRNLMRLRPMPVVMISTLTEASAEVTLEALRIGAFDFVTKPKPGDDNSLKDYQFDILDKIRGASKANLCRLEKNSQTATNKEASSPEMGNYKPRYNTLVTIGASTGGTEAIKQVIEELPVNFPPVVIAQHIPPSFSTSYSARLDKTAKVKVWEAENDQVLENGNVYIAPGDKHLVIRRSGLKLLTRLSDADKVNRHRPSVDVLFDSVRSLKVKHTLGVLLTGMGADGAEGLLRLKQAGAHTIIQDENSSVVWGMPGAAHKLNAHDEMMALSKVAQRLIQLTHLDLAKTGA